MLHLLTIAPCGGVLKGDTTGCVELRNMDFSLIDYLDENACYGKLVELLHPDGLACPALRSAATPGGPPPPPGAGPGLPVR